MRRCLAQHRRRSRLGANAPRSRTFPYAFYCALVIEHLLPRRYLGDSLIDRILSPLHGGSIGGRALKKLPLAMQTFRARLFVAQTAHLLLAFSTVA